MDVRIMNCVVIRYSKHIVVSLMLTHNCCRYLLLYLRHTHSQDVVRVQDSNPEFMGKSVEKYEPVHGIYTGDGMVNETAPGYGFHAVAWQHAPLMLGTGPDIYNYDQYYGMAAPDIEETRTSRRVLIGKSPNVQLDPDDEIMAEVVQGVGEWSKLLLPPEKHDYAFEPVTLVSYPILDTLETVRTDVNSEATVVGTVASVVSIVHPAGPRRCD